MQMNRTKYQFWHKLGFNQKPGIYNKLQNLNAGALIGFERVGAKLYCSPYDLTPKTIYDITSLKILGVNNFFPKKLTAIAWRPQHTL